VEASLLDARDTVDAVPPTPAAVAADRSGAPADPCGEPQTSQ
jgi:hypothetical protein